MEKVEQDEGLDYLLHQRLPATVRAWKEPLHCDAAFWGDPCAPRLDAPQATGIDMHA